MKHIKIRTYSPNDAYGPLVNPLRREIPIQDGSKLLDSLQLQCSYGDQSMYVDFVDRDYIVLTCKRSALVDWIDFTGFIAWTPSIKGYTMPSDTNPLTWDPASAHALQIIGEMATASSFWEKLGLLYSQESSRGNSSIEIRVDNVDFIKTLFKVSLPT
jgi:proteasome activator subunit 4